MNHLLQEIHIGDPLSPTILNMVVYAGICHWATGVTGGDSGTEGFWRVVQKLAVRFYVDSGLLAPTWLARIQEAPYVLMGLFDQVEIWKNFNKMVGMACQPCCTAGR